MAGKIITQSESQQWKCLRKAAVEDAEIIIFWWQSGWDEMTSDCVHQETSSVWRQEGDHLHRSFWRCSQLLLKLFLKPSMTSQTEASQSKINFLRKKDTEGTSWAIKVLPSSDDQPLLQRWAHKKASKQEENWNCVPKRTRKLFHFAFKSLLSDEKLFKFDNIYEYIKIFLVVRRMRWKFTGAAFLSRVEEFKRRRQR